MPDGLTNLEWAMVDIPDRKNLVQELAETELLLSEDTDT